VYHRIAEPLVDPWALCVSPERFAEQLALLQRVADLVPLDVIVGARSDQDLPDRPIAITFDDGYVDNLIHAMPILEHLGVPATVFVATGFLDATNEVWSDELARLILLSDEDPMRLALLVNLRPESGLQFRGDGKHWHAWEPALELRQWVYCRLYERLLHATDESRADMLERVRSWCGQRPMEVERSRFLTSGELTELASSRWIEIGAHSVTHPVLADLEPAQQRHEISASKHKLEMLIGKPVQSFAYPYGKKNHFNSDTIHAIQSAGFRCGCANYGRMVTRKTSRWALPRYQVLNWQANSFAGEINQWYQA
jgi:peptidoglycan/xylan/chitin deacetylase (PgdA/CDA1 family)